MNESDSHSPMFEYRASQPAYDQTRERLWVERMGEVCGKEFSHMMHERRRLLNVFTELLVLIRFEVEANHRRRMALHMFTSMVRDTFWREVLLGLSRFSDEPRGKVPMSLVSWNIRHATDWSEEKQAELRSCVDAFALAARPIKKLRDYHLAHSDARALKAKEPRKASLDQVADAFAALGKALCVIETHYGIQPIADLPYPSSLGGAESFVSMVNQSSLEHS